MKSRFYIYIALAIVLFLSGCLGSGRTKTDIVSQDMLKIKSIDIFPAKDVQTNDAIIIRMEVDNVGQDDSYLLVDKDSTGNDNNWNGDYLLIDHCSTLYRQGIKDSDFQILSGGRCVALDDKVPIVKDSGGNDIKGNACYVKLGAQSSQTFQWAMKAPSDDDIAKMTQKCMFKFQIAYAAKAVTNTYVYFAAPLEVAQRIYTQKDMSLAGDNIASYGPVAVNFVPAAPQPIPAASGTNWTVFLNMRNVGEGIADVNSINMDTGSITKAYPGLMASGCRMIEDITQDVSLVEAMKKKSGDVDLMSGLKEFTSCDIKTPTQCPPALKQLATDYYTKYCSGTDIDEKCNKKLSELENGKNGVLDNELQTAKRQLQIYSQQSSRIPCELTVPSDITILTPSRFVTTADYTYRIRQDIQITAKPVQNI